MVQCVYIRTSTNNSATCVYVTDFQFNNNTKCKQLQIKKAEYSYNLPTFNIIYHYQITVYKITQYLTNLPASLLP